MNTIQMPANNQPKQTKLYVWLEPEAKAKMERLKHNTGNLYTGLSHMARVWIDEKLAEAEDKGLL